MSASLTLHVLLLEDDYAVLSSGSDPRHAIQRHFNELDMFCSPPSNYTTEESGVSVFSVPEAIEDAVAGDLEELETDERAEVIQRLAGMHPEITRTEMEFAYESGELRVSQVEPITL